MIVDAVVLLLHHNRFRDPKTAVERLAVNGRELSTALHLLTGFTLRSFIEHYRLMEAQEYLACTGLATKEIARRCGYTGRTEEKTFHKMFKLLTGMCVLSYRRQHRPRNFQDLYSWIESAVVRNRTECPKPNTVSLCLRLIISQIYLWHGICSSVEKRNGYETDLDFVFNLYHRSM